MHFNAFMQNEMIACEGEKCKSSPRDELIRAANLSSTAPVIHTILSAARH
jgi:hypothetical protein